MNNKYVNKPEQQLFYKLTTGVVKMMRCRNDHHFYYVYYLYLNGSSFAREYNISLVLSSTATTRRPIIGGGGPYYGI